MSDVPGISPLVEATMGGCALFEINDGEYVAADVTRSVGARRDDIGVVAGDDHVIRSVKLRFAHHAANEGPSRRVRDVEDGKRVYFYVSEIEIIA